MNVFPGLAAKLRAQYDKAVKSGEVIFTESSVEESEERGIPFEIRFAPQLGKKPTKDNVKAETKPADPFAPPYKPDLYIAEDSVQDGDEEEQFVLLLNKYCLMPRHFLLVTKDFASQTSPLTGFEFAACWSILKQLSAREKFIAFFNSGDQSGASQPHKHFQFIPVTNGTAPFDGFVEDHKPERPKRSFSLPLPYANFVTTLRPPQDESPVDYFNQKYVELLDDMIQHLRTLPSDTIPDVRISRVSYNMVMTKDYLELVPRSKECFTTDAGEQISINSLGFAGYVLTKTESALSAVKRAGVLSVLKEIGLPAESAVEPVDVTTDAVET